MGFYGNITNTNRTQFVFDKTFHNRAEMDNLIKIVEDENGNQTWQDVPEEKQNIANDGVFIGRYVLVDYDNQINNVPYRRVYSSFGSGGNKFLFFDINNEANSIVRFLDEDYYTTDENGNLIINPKRDKDEYRYYLFRDEIVYTLEDNVYTYYKAEKAYTSIYIPNAGLFKENDNILRPTETEKPGNTVTDTYYINFSKDREKYPNAGRGWDSTVWQKVHVNEETKYVMVAELNSVVPTFDLTVDQPTRIPNTPHFDADSTNVYYKLHVQPPWGFDIKEAGEDEYSDEEISFKENHIINTSGTIESREVGPYKGAIYYNKDGFDSSYRYEKEKIEDKIELTPTRTPGEEDKGNKYNSLESDIKHKEQQGYYPDVMGLSINLPSIGDTVSTMWNLIYGKGEDIGEEGRFKRNKNIDWGNLSGLRLVSGDEEGSGFTYSPEKVETLAGCINSVHDLMGAIITEKPASIDEALTNRIYYGNYDLDHPEQKGFYFKDLTYEFEDGTADDDYNRAEGLVDFSLEDYYYLYNDNYYLESKYQPGNIYYQISDINIKPLIGGYEAGKYYYYQNGDYILETETNPDENKTYYIVEKEYSKTINNNINNEDGYYTFFFPTSQEYYDKLKEYLDLYSEHQGIWNVDPDDGSYNTNGFFYMTEVNGVTKWAPYDKVNTIPPQDLRWFENVRYELVWSVEDSQFKLACIPFEASDEAVSKKLVMTSFEAGKFYSYDEELRDNIQLKSENDIDLNKEYFSFDQEAITQVTGLIDGVDVDFYEPNLYYYRESNNYILAKEEDILQRDYFTIGDIAQTTRKFYEPNTYYYINKYGNYVLDTSSTITEGREYYLEPVSLYVVSDENNIYQAGAKWNNLVEVPAGVQLGRRSESYQFKELRGFARTLNTIHGLILEINNILKTEDILTRDTSTVQGCINTINDIIKKINRLKPGNVMIVNKYGQMTSAESQGDNWIAVSVDPVEETISLEHTGPIEGTPNVVNSVEPAFGEVFNITDYHYDDKGHKYGETSHTIKIPQGSYVDSDNINGQKVITKIEFEPTIGAITSTSSNLSAVEIAESETLGDCLSSLQENINNEEAARVAADNVLQTNIDTEASERKAADNVLQQNIDAEVEARENAIATEITARENAINTEATARENAINTEITTRESAVSEEAAKRETADNTLSDRIKSLEIKSAKWDKAEKNVQSNWEETDTSSDAYILNKPDLSKVVQTDTKISYRLGEEKTLEEMWAYISELENRLETVENKLKTFIAD